MSDPIPTGCGPLDELLGGGFERGTVTQIYGPPAAGKTNLVLSAAAAVAAEGGTTVVVDTEGLSIDRFEQVVGARAGDGPAGRDATAAGDRENVIGDRAAGDDPAASHDQPASDEPRTGDEQPDSDEPQTDDESPSAIADVDAAIGQREEGSDADAPDLQTLAERIVVQDALDFDEQREAVKDAEAFAEQADLIALDSATGFYRLQRDQDEEGGEALRAVADQITHLLSLARREDLAVVITNQVYTDPEEDRIHALGGHTLDHWTGTILRLDRFRGGNRRATLEKHRAKPAGESAQFQITDRGLEGAEQDRL